MKDWDYYTYTTANYYGLDYRKNYREGLIRIIDDAPTTKADREIALGKIAHQVRDHMREVNEPYTRAIGALQAEFWADAKAELGYDDFLDAYGIRELENLAYDRGHAHGFSSIFSELQELSFFAEKIAQSATKKALDKSTT